MLRKRSRTTSKQALMADYSSIQSPRDKYKKPTSSILTSPRLFTGFATKVFTDTDTVMMSPTSILDSKPFSALKIPFRSDTNTTKAPKPETKTNFDKLDSRKVGLGIVDALIDEMSDPKPSNKPESRMVLFGSQLKIQIPHMPPSVFSPSGSPQSPAGSGRRTRNSQAGCFSPGFSSPAAKKSPFRSVNSGLENQNSPRVFSGCLSASEMELSEDYTCVISRGPNPRTTHIFDDCIIESFYGASNKESENGFVADRPMSYPSESFLSFCYNCKKNLGHGKDIYMYRGDKAFCSSECRYKEMMIEEGKEKLESGIHGTCS